MSAEDTVTPSTRYATLGRRFYAFRIDLFLYLGVFLTGSIVSGILFEDYPAGRIATFALMLAFLVAYEPVMVARYGGTFGHQRANIRISCAETGLNLPFWRAAVRSLVKQFFGVFSFFFMFLNSRAQGLHDLAAGAKVTIRDPSITGPQDHFLPMPSPPGVAASPIRRIAVVALYNVLLFVLMTLVAAVAVSPECIEPDACSGFDDLILSILGGWWLILSVAIIVLGWTGRLAGCRPKTPVPDQSPDTPPEAPC